MAMIRIINTDEIAYRKDYKDERKREFIISNERRDSHGTVIRMDGWKIEDFNRSGAFYYQHLTGSWEDPNPDNALGPASAYREGTALIGVADFEPEEINPLAAKILGKVDYGTLTNTSVGFVPVRGHWGQEKADEDPKTYYFDEQVLKEFSIVHIPSNPDAIKKSMETYDRYMAQVAETHVSEGFKRDYRKELNRIRSRREYLLNLCANRNIL
jgi:hypothetical protein